MWPACLGRQHEDLARRSPLLVQLGAEGQVHKDCEEVKVGETAVLRCDVTTEPRRELSVRWLFNDEPVDFDSNPRMLLRSDNSFIITRVVKQDSGVYTCVAKTEADSDRASATLVVLGVPDPPEIRSVICEEFSALVRWTSQDDDLMPILYFSVQYTTNHEPGLWDYGASSIPASDKEFRLSLRPRTTYKFRVVAHNKAGPSPPSKPSQMACRTNTDVPHRNPERVFGRWDNSGDLVISWKPMPPSEHHAPGFGYIVWWRADFPGTSWSGRPVMDWTQSSLVLRDMRSDRPHRVRVEAHNVRGKARVSDEDVFVGRGDKGQRAQSKLSGVPDMLIVALATIAEVIGAMW
ncbi:hypothetical protein HPB50_005008 [Hyalomma asiaticum]|uniref:Uncharacterized protein n=1 Tax=Hyalomma asiaticum TaxID=266040 RepID=A0ACB7RJ33_HYAAI|nr:hypothetical protein HPB50_005008 [Hyalomma asiaticum]